MKDVLTGRIAEMLESAGFLVSDCRMVRSSFDLIARKGEVLLLVKVLQNIEGLTSKAASELKSVSSAMAGTPLVIGERMKNAPLAAEVVYTRYDIRVLSPDAFENLLHQRTPQVYSIRGNYCVRVDPAMLHRIRNRASITQEDLAGRLGVSKQSIHRYESTGRVSLEVAEKLMRFLTEDLIEPGDIFRSELRHLEEEISTCKTDLKRTVYEELRGMGFSASLTNAPFDIFAFEKRSDERILTVASNDAKGIRNRVEIVKEISEITGYRTVCISNRTCDPDVVTIRPHELRRMRVAEELIRLFEE